MLIKCVEQYNFYLPFPATPVLLLCTPATETLSVVEDVASMVRFLIFMCEQNYIKVNFMLHTGLATVYTFKFKFLYFFMDDI
jgi:hypothetical protein